MLPNTTAVSAVENGITVPDMTGERPTGTGLPKMRYVEPTPVSKVQPINQNDVATTTKVDGSDGLNGSNEVNVADVADVNPYGEVKDIKELDMMFKPPYKEETPEEKAQREKREQIKVGFTGLMDGLNALSNLYYTTKGAPSQKLQGAMPAVVGNIREQEALRRAQEQANRKAEFDWNKAKADYELERSLKAMQWDAAQKQAEKDNLYKTQAILLQAKINEGEELTKHERELAKILAQYGYNVQLEGLKSANAKSLQEQKDNAAMARVKAGKNGRGSENTDSITLMGKDKKAFKFDYDKSANGALIAVYNKINRHIKELNDKKEKGEAMIPYLGGKYSLDENADVSEKMLTSIRSRAVDFPELTDEIIRLLRGDTREGNPMADDREENPML